MSDYAARIRAARAYAGITQQDLADHLEVDEQTVKRRESGKQDPKKAERAAIAAHCGVPPEFIEGGWAALAAPPSEEQIRLAASLLEPSLLRAAQALRQAAAGDSSHTDEPDRPPPRTAADAA